MKFIIKPMERAEAVEVSNWKYQGPYDFYSHSGSEEEVQRLLQGYYYAVKSQEGKLIGYFCFGKPSQVPDGHKYGAYDDLSYLDMGLGMEPSLTGKGKGGEFVLSGIEFATNNLNITKIRLTVAVFNQRAIKTYEKVGFKKGLTFERFRSNGELIQFMMMHLNR